MTLQHFSQALLSEHLLIVSCEAYRPVDQVIEQINLPENFSQRLCICLPYTTLMAHKKQLSDLSIWKGLSDIPSADSDTFTKDIVVRFVNEAEVDFAVIGGSTARHILYESDQSVAAKLRALLETNAAPVVCFGESLQDYIRGLTPSSIKEQLSVLLLGLSFEQIIRVILVYRAPWLNSIAPEVLKEESQKAHKIVIDALQQIIGHDAASHISLLTDLPYISTDYSSSVYDIPPSGYFIELEGRNPRVVSNYFEILATEARPYKKPPPKIKAPERIIKPAEPIEPKIQQETKAPEAPAPAKRGRPRKKKEESIVEEPVDEVVEDSLHHTILSVDNELEDPTIHFEMNEPTQVVPEEEEASTEEEFQFDWYSDEELEALRKEFGIQPDGTMKMKPLPVWDNTRPVRIIKTQSQKAQAPEKPTKSKNKGQKDKGL